MTKLSIVQVPAVKHPIQPSQFQKKELADDKIDFMMLCSAGCTYCSTNRGTLHRVRRAEHTRLTEAQLGRRVSNVEIRGDDGEVTHQVDPGLTFITRDVIDNLKGQLAGKPASWGSGKTLMTCQLTDLFSPPIVADGTTREGLELLLEKTSYRMRVLTKMDTIRRSEWMALWKKGHEMGRRFVLGLSIGTLDDDWARRVEINTSSPTARLRALHALQDAGLPTYGMLCPVFPDVLDGHGLEDLIDAIRPTHHTVEHVWCEPYNDRDNWQAVRAGYEERSAGWSWMTAAFGPGASPGVWSAYAAELYTRLIAKARREGWASKVRFLLYERGIADAHLAPFAPSGERPLEGVLLQDKPGDHGRSKHPWFAAMQRDAGAGR